jgi:hypothetical protein
MIRRLFIAAVIALAALPAFAADAGNALVFGQIRLGGKEPLVLAYRLTVRNIDTRKIERIHLSPSETAKLTYDFAESLPPGRYYLLNMTAPNSDAEYRIGDARSPFEVKEDATVYIGTWTVALGIPTTTFTIDYDVGEINRFAKANPSRDTAKFMVAAPGKQAVLLKGQ